MSESANTNVKFGTGQRSLVPKLNRSSNDPLHVLIRCIDADSHNNIYVIVVPCVRSQNKIRVYTRIQGRYVSYG